MKMQLSRRRQWFFRLLLASFSILMTCLLAEIGLRVHKHFSSDIKLSELEQSRKLKRAEDGKSRFGDFVRASSHRGVIYEMIPNTYAVFKDHPVQVNSAGFRNPEIKLAKPENTIRILGLGDSVMFGWGTHESECYLSKLTSMLKQQHSEVDWQYINTAVPGYNTAMQADVLELKGLAYAPDIVIVGLVHNDIWLPNFILNRESPLTIEKSYLWDFFQQATDSKKRHSIAGLMERPTREITEETEHLIPQEYRYMVGLDGYRRAMEKIAKICREHEIELVVLSHIWQSDELFQGFGNINEELKVDIVSPQRRLKDYMVEHGIDDPLGSELTYSETDGHPSSIWHEFCAEALFEYVENRTTLKDRFRSTSTKPPVTTASGKSESRLQ